MGAERPKFSEDEKAAIEAYNKQFGTSYNLTYAHFKVAEPDSEYNRILEWAGLPVRGPPKKQDISRSLADARGTSKPKPAMSTAGGSGRKSAVPQSPGPAAATGLRGMNVPIFSINEGALSSLIGKIMEVRIPLSWENNL